MENSTTHTIDAANKSIGRIATEAAILLRGKDTPEFRQHKGGSAVITVTNFSKVRLTGNKEAQKVYYRHTGYLGGLKKKKLSDVMEKDPKEALRRAVWGMLPRTRLRDEQIKRLHIEL